MEIPTRIRGVLALEANPSLVPSPVPRRERVERLWMTLLGLAFNYLCRSPFLNVSIPMQSL
jgi:hypothetical protein